MLQESDSRVAPTISTKPYAVEIKEECAARSSASVIDFFDAREQKASASDASGRNPVLLPDTVYLTRKRARAIRLINPVEDWLYLLISAVTLGFLMITFLGL
jgi:hypothetical protein